MGISKRITDEEERCRLKEILLSIRNEKFGYILRTAAEGATKEQLEAEMALLVGTWRKILAKEQGAATPSLLNRDLTVTLRAVRDLLTDEADRLTIDSKRGYRAVTNFLQTHMPGNRVSVELYTGSEPLFDVYNLERDIARALKKKVWLKSGG